MFEPETGIFAANKVMRELGGSGAVGYVETEKKVVFPEQVVRFVEQVYFIDGLSIHINKNYTVTINGEVYPNRKATGVEGAGDLVVIGNASLTDPDLPNTGENWMIGHSTLDGVTMMVIMDSVTGEVYSDDVTISIVEETETIHPIDPKYLPGAVVPVVDLSYETLIASAGSGTDVEVTATEAEMLSEAWATKLPIIVRVVNSNFYVSKTVYAAQFAGARKHYIAGEVAMGLGIYTLELYQDDASWMLLCKSVT